MVECFLMFRAEKQKARIRRDAKRLFPQVVKVEIQVWPPIPSYFKHSVCRLCLRRLAWLVRLRREQK
jgi:hypothetical protein